MGTAGRAPVVTTCKAINVLRTRLPRQRIQRALPHQLQPPKRWVHAAAVASAQVAIAGVVTAAMRRARRRDAPRAGVQPMGTAGLAPVVTTCKAINASRTRL